MTEVTIRHTIAAIIEAAAFDVYVPKDRITRIRNALAAADKIIAVLAVSAAQATESTE